MNDLSYERLEWVGDAYVELTATLLISQTFPAFSPGKSSQMREGLVKNVTLAKFARQYGFEKRAILPPLQVSKSSKETDKIEADRVKILGDIFEAYVAAIVLSDPANGVARVSDWLKGLWAQVLANQIRDEEKYGLNVDNPMWRLRGTKEPVKTVASKAEVTLNAKDQLRLLITVPGAKVNYKDAAKEYKDPETKLPMFTVGVYLDGWGEKDKFLGIGTAHGKKEAGMKAASNALENKKLLKPYAEKKKLYVQQEKEREALKAEAEAK